MKYARLIQKVLFYLSSFIPLYLLLVIQNIKVRDIDGDLLEVKEFINQFTNTSLTITLFWITLLLLFLMSLFGMFLFFLVYAKKDGRVATIKNTEFIREDTMGYIVTYIVPLLSMNVESSRSLIINLILFLIIGTFYVKNDQIFMNPLYNIFGYNVFSAEKDIYITKIRKSKLRIIAKQNLQVRKINLIGDIYVLKNHQIDPCNPDDLYE